MAPRLLGKYMLSSKIMFINKSFKYRIYPTKEQEAQLLNQFGQCRFVYNYFLRKRIDYYALNKGKTKQSLNYHDTCKMLTALKRQPEFIWLNQSNSQSLQQSLKHLEAAYTHFFRDGFQFPTFKKKGQRQSFTVPQNFSLEAGKSLLHIPKMNPLKIRLHRKIEERAKHVTISMNPSGKYFASILCEIPPDVKPKKRGKQIGIDLGLKSFLVTSEGDRVDPPKFLRNSEQKLKKVQRHLSRKKKGSKNRIKARIKVARLHDKTANQRTDFLHKLSHRLVSENQAIFAEDLNVKGMVRNHCLAKSISDCGWSEFLRQIQYKSEWNGAVFGQIDRFFPSSKRCNACGRINESLSLNNREWDCRDCGTIVDRDLNAAQNILLFGQKSVGRDTPKPKRLGRGGAVRPLVEPRSPWL